MQNYFTHRSHLMITIIGAFVLVLGLATPGFTVGPPDNPLDEILDRLGPCNIPPVWGKTYPLDQRFVPVLGGAAFCDKATGLVWDGSPDPDPQTSWDFAVVQCTTRTVGGQNGFHLPLIEQLASLLPLLVTELNSATGDGPFSNVVIADYWSATTRQKRSQRRVVRVFRR